jgi:hypothetical protein
MLYAASFALTVAFHRAGQYVIAEVLHRGTEEAPLNVCSYDSQASDSESQLRALAIRAAIITSRPASASCLPLGQAS